MRIVFWQNCLSPHQLPYICHLMDDDRVDEVIIVAEEEISAERKRMGWQLGDYCGIERCKLYIKPDDGVIYRLLEEKQDESVHLFSGIHSFPYIFKCLKMSLSYKIKRGIITEIPYTYAWGCKNGKPLWLHRIRFFCKIRNMQKKWIMCLLWERKQHAIFNRCIKDGMFFRLYIVQLLGMRAIMKQSLV